jgi:hypothetical protein
MGFRWLHPVWLENPVWVENPAIREEVKVAAHFPIRLSPTSYPSHPPVHIALSDVEE